jgi:deazaflavin-dependent oxidoreductase (nitroreductase family)
VASVRHRRRSPDAAVTESSPLLDDELRAAPECRLTTIGRVSGQPREIPIWFAAVGDRVFLLAGGREGAHWVRNVQATPEVRVRLGTRTFEGRGAVVEGQEDDPVARAAIAAKYGTKYLSKWLRESLPVRIDLDREVA